jgi:6-pyruvoyltetrahydropterin/6-carboxytetrahydropterin synthase
MGRVIRLMREVRFFAESSALQGAAGPINSWAGTRTGSGPPFWTVRITVEGPAHDETGYVCDIKILDELIRSHVAPGLSATPHSFEGSTGAVIRAMEPIVADLPAPLRLISVQVRFSPGTHLTLLNEGREMLLTQSYEFAASHRLGCPGKSDEENLRLFGKCSNPNGHGHNYVLEVTVTLSGDSPGTTLAALDGIVQCEVIQPFDHKNLNVECKEFQQLNPTVENIAQVIFDRLSPVVAPLRLASVRVWETPKTYAECTGSRTQERR